MEVMQVLHMNYGEGETSYAKNSNIQKKKVQKIAMLLEFLVHFMEGVSPTRARILFILRLVSIGSQVPFGLATNARTTLNKGKLYISQTSPSDVIKAYVSQFQNDFSLFLRSRSPEMVPGGRMLLSLMGRSSIDPTIEDGCYYQWELLAHALSILVSKGLVEEEKIDSFNAPYYAPCPEELKIAVEKEGSFIVNRIEAFEIEWDASVSSNSSTQCEDKKILLSRGQQVAKTIRAVVESMVENHFGNEIMDDLFSIYSDLVGDFLYKKKAVYVNLVVSLTRKN
ncbi:Jasmonate O-methyltransferase [Capsicum annuum]|nr:Jasmonate O-methyltransferase [Capsicum annuum]KAF3629751.1 Jasmonate O-methyltransferase [Capsicum annuum]